MKKWAKTMLVAGLSMSLVACTSTNDSKGNNSTKSNDSNVLNLNNGSEPTSFDPPIGFDSVSWNALNNLMEGLTRLDENNKPQPAAAESWEISEDGKVYTFKLRKDAKWSNGEPVLASDFEFAWKRLANPATASPAAFLTEFIVGAEAYVSGKGTPEDMLVKAEDDLTLVVTLNSPTGFFLNLVSNPAFFPVDQDTVESDPDWAAEAETFVGNGPFELTDWQHESEFTFKKNEDYWDAANVKLDEVHWAMIDDTNTEYQMFKTGDLHSSDVPADLFEQLNKSGEAKIEDQAGTYFYRFNLDQEPFQNENIRKAFAMAVNQNDIVDYVTKSGEEPAFGFVGYGFEEPSGKDFRDIGGELVTWNKDEAKNLLEKGMKEEGYKALPQVTMTYNTSDSHKKIAEALQQMFKETLDVDIKLANMEWNVFSDEQKAGKLQFSRGSFLADYGDPINFLENFQTGHSMNRTGWSNKEFDAMIEEAKQTKDEEKRFELMHDAEELLFNEMPIFPIHFYNQVYLQDDSVEGIVRHPVGYMELKNASFK